MAATRLWTARQSMSLGYRYLLYAHEASLRGASILTVASTCVKAIVDKTDVRVVQGMSGVAAR